MESIRLAPALTFFILGLMLPVWLFSAEDDPPAPATTPPNLDRRFSFVWEAMTVADALRDVAKKAGLKLELIGEDKDYAKRYHHEVQMILKDVRVRDILMMLCAKPGLQLEMRGASVRISIVPAELTVYPSMELTHVPGRMLVWKGQMLRGGWEQPTGDDDPTRGIAKDLTACDVADMIRDCVEPESWDPELGTSIEERSGRLVVMQRPEVHKKIRRFLAEFRARYSSRMKLNVRLLQVRSSDVESIMTGARSRGHHGGLLDREAVNGLDELVRQGAAKSVHSGTALLQSGQGGLLRQTRERRFVWSYTPIEEQLEPRVATASLGTSIWLCPRLSFDSRNVRLSLRAAWQDLAGEPKPFEVLRGGPVSSQDGKAGAGAGRNPPPTVAEGYQVYLPTLARSRIHLDMDVPLGAYACVSMPATGVKGPIPGTELLLVTHVKRISAPLPQAEDKPLAFSEEIAGKLVRDVKADFEEVKLSDALKYLAEETGVSIVVDCDVVDDTPITWSGGRLPAKKVLAELMRWFKCSVRPFESVLLVSSGHMPLSVRVHDMRDCSTTFKDGVLSEFRNLDDRDRSSGAGVTFVTPKSHLGLSVPDVAQLLRDRLMPERFSDAATSIEARGGPLVVVQSVENHGILERHLSALRSTFCTSVRLTAHWLTVPSDALPGEVSVSLDRPQTAKVLKVLSHAGTRLLGTTRLTAYAGHQVCAFGGLTRPQIKGYTVDGDYAVPDVRVAAEGLGFQFRLLNQSEAQLDGVAEEICVQTCSYLSAFGPPAALQEPFPSNPEKATGTTPNEKPAPGLIHSAAGCRVGLENTLRIRDGGAVLMRYAVPKWLGGEPENAAERAKRTLLLIVCAERRR